MLLPFIVFVCECWICVFHGSLPLILEFFSSHGLSTHIPGLDFDAREKLGQQCKRLLDIGRVMYLREKGFDAELVYYVDKETSLENLALMAVPK